jgi:hypothetical protein
MLARRVCTVALVGTSACFPSFEGLSGSARSDSTVATKDAAELDSTDAAGEIAPSIEGGDADGSSSPEGSDAADETQEGGILPPPGAPTAGIYLYWPFESGSSKVAEDVSGNHRNGTLLNVSTSTDQAPTIRPGNVRSIKFEAAQSSLAFLADTPTESYTIGMWIKPAARASALIVTRADANGTLLMQLRVTGAGVFEHYVNDGSTGAGCQSEPGSCIVGTTVIKGSTWYHVAVSAKSRGEMHLYVNGFEEGTSRALMQFANTGERYDFGFVTGRSTAGFQGVVDEVIVYDWVLPAVDVNKLAAPM